MTDREHLLHELARNYVVSLGRGDFDSIPYHPEVELRAPFCPGGSTQPLKGRSNLRQQWWTPMPQLVAGTELIGTYVNADLTAVAAEFRCHIRQPDCMLRVVDRFTVNDAGQIVAQENFFDPRDVTHPGWRDHHGELGAPNHRAGAAS